MPGACPCGSGATDDACCAPLIAGTTIAPTALALMRSRYTAYVRGAITYLLATHSPTTRATVDVAAVTAWSRDTLWMGLEILDSGPGVVEFIARGVTRGKPFAQRERSRFEQVEGRWYYVDAS